MEKTNAFLVALAFVSLLMSKVDSSCLATPTPRWRGPVLCSLFLPCTNGPKTTTKRVEKVRCKPTKNKKVKDTLEKDQRKTFLRSLVSMSCGSTTMMVGGYLNVDCYTTHRNSEFEVLWHLNSTSGNMTDLGTCYDTYTCVSPHTNLRLNRNSYRSYITLNEVQASMAGTYICTEVFENGTSETESCEVKIAYIRQSSCYDGKLTIEEGSYESMSCEAAYSNLTVSWILQPLQGQPVTLANCSDNRCTSLTDEYSFTVYGSYKYYTVNFRSATREVAGELICSDGTFNDTCTMEVYGKGLIAKCKLVAHKSNWTLTGTCLASQFYSSHGDFEFSISQQRQSDPKQAPMLVYHNLFEGRKRFYLDPYTDLSTGRTYYQGTLTYSWPMPTAIGNYTYFFSTFPAGRSEDTDERFEIVPPSQLSHNCTKLQYLPEVGQVPCVCSTTSVGLPEGRLQWYAGDTILATGDYNVTSLNFPHDVVRRYHDGLPIGCRLDWAEPHNVSLGKHVAYGPDNVTIELHELFDVNGVRRLVALCQVMSMKPMLHDQVVWGGLCKNRTGVSCMVNAIHPQDDGKEITCTVSNRENNGHTVRASVRVSLNEPGPVVTTKRPHTSKPKPTPSPTTVKPKPSPTVPHGQGPTPAVTTPRPVTQSPPKPRPSTSSPHKHHPGHSSGTPSPHHTDKPDSPTRGPSYNPDHPVHQASTGQDNDGKDVGKQAGIGAGIGVTVAIVLMVTAVAGYLLWKRRKDERQPFLYDRSLEMSPADEAAAPYGSNQGVGPSFPIPKGSRA